MSHQGNRDREDNVGQPGRESEKPAGTSGRTGNTGTENQPTDQNRPASRPRRHDDDDDSGLGNRTGLR
jgi:hypothetical protein